MLWGKYSGLYTYKNIPVFSGGKGHPGTLVELVLLSCSRAYMLDKGSYIVLGHLCQFFT